MKFPKFKKGDWVRCKKDIEYEKEITKGVEYLVTDDSFNSTTFIINNYNKVDWYSSSRFELGTALKRIETINEILK